MAKAFINDENLTDIADAIRATLDESRQYLPSEMAAAIDSIPIMAQLNRKKYFRPVPSGAASGYATIEKIEGNTVVWNNLLSSGMFVDMGLPSGLLWASSNIDVTQPNGLAASPYQYGCSFFSWGNVQGYNPVSNSFVGVYDWGSVNGSSPWYDNQPYGSTAGCSLTGDIPVGDTYDAGRQNVRSLWKMPSSADFQELLNNCDFLAADGTTIPSSTTDKRITYNGVVGLRLKSQNNGNELFFACCGYGSNTAWNALGASGNYWTKNYIDAKDVRVFYFGPTGVFYNLNIRRNFGQAIRPVIAPVSTITTGHSNHKYAMNDTKDNCYDLTATFGAGNEPTIVADFEAWLAQNIGTLPYYDYNAGELLSVKMQSAKSVGFNQWDESMWAMGGQEDTYEHYLQANSASRGNPLHYDTLRFLPNTRYTIQYQLKQGTSSNARLTVYYTDGTFEETGSNNTTTYQLIRFVTAYGKTVDYISLTYSSSGRFYVKELMVCVGNNTSMAFEPYQADSADIDVTTITGINTSTNVRETIFPNGMKKADRAGTVKDELDLLSDTATVNVGSRAYQSGDESDTDVLTDGTTTYYALTTPIEYTDLQDANGNPLNPRYKVEQGGTEQVLPVNTSTPTTVAPTLSTIYKKNI